MATKARSQQASSDNWGSAMPLTSAVDGAVSVIREFTDSMPPGLTLQVLSPQGTWFTHRLNSD